MGHANVKKTFSEYETAANKHMACVSTQLPKDLIKNIDVCKSTNRKEMVECVTWPVRRENKVVSK